jgi:hypothetical protein
MSAAMARPEVRTERSTRMRQRFADPAIRQLISEKTRAAMASPEVRQRIREGMRAAPAVAAERRRLADARGQARPGVRREFIALILAPLSRKFGDG